MAERQYCKHYKGSGKCVLGHDADYMNRSAACLGVFASYCDDSEYENPEEVAKKERELNEWGERFSSFMSRESDLCPHCGKKVEHVRQVGRCVYGSCGCRLYQGTIPPVWRG